MQDIIAEIRRLTGRDISGYAESFLHKAVNQRMQESSSRTTEDYVRLLSYSMEERTVLLNSLNISFSMFFRDTLDYSIIEKYILPSINQRKKQTPSSSIRIWSAGCAEGQEPYTLAIICDELVQNMRISMYPLIIATDIAENALIKAASGTYYSNSLEQVGMARIESCFVRHDQLYQVKPHLKKHVEFSLYDMLDGKTSSPPSGIFGGYDLVICSNLMVYYQREIQELILEKIHHSLDSKGFLMVDPSEKTIVKAFGGFRLYSALSNIFVKI